MPTSLLERFRSITTFVFDVDGVLTDGTLWTFDDGQMVRRMNIKDGYALQLAIKKGYRILVISGGASMAVHSRLEKLGVSDIYMQVSDKAAILQNYCNANGLAYPEVLFMGDDIPDFGIMQLAGIACAPSDAVSEIKQVAHYISPLAGGGGCVRDVIEKVMKLRGDWSLDTSVSSK